MKVPFFKDPAPRTAEGHFTVELTTPSDVVVKIWRYDVNNGAMTREERVSNLATGQNRIAWNMKDDSGSTVTAGEYLATLAAEPRQHSLDKQVYFASFQVIN